MFCDPWYGLQPSFFFMRVLCIVFDRTPSCRIYFTYTLMLHLYTTLPFNGSLDSYTGPLSLTRKDVWTVKVTLNVLYIIIGALPPTLILVKYVVCRTRLHEVILLVTRWYTCLSSETSDSTRTVARLWVLSVSCLYRRLWVWTFRRVWIRVDLDEVRRKETSRLKKFPVSEVSTGRRVRVVEVYKVVKIKKDPSRSNYRERENVLMVIIYLYEIIEDRFSFFFLKVITKIKEL